MRATGSDTHSCELETAHGGTHMDCPDHCSYSLAKSQCPGTARGSCNSGAISPPSCKEGVELGYKRRDLRLLPLEGVYIMPLLSCLRKLYIGTPSLRLAPLFAGDTGNMVTCVPAASNPLWPQFERYRQPCHARQNNLTDSLHRLSCLALWASNPLLLQTYNS